MRPSCDELQAELCQLQDWVRHTGARIIVVFEGRDAAGKGGTIQRAHRARQPARLPHRSRRRRPPTARRSRCTCSGTSLHFPAAGEVVIFDRSWYNRAGVERVMGFCTEAGLRAFPRSVPGVREARWSRSGIRLIKYWLEVERREAEAPLPGPDRGPVAAVEAQPDRPALALEAGTRTRAPVTPC